MAVPKNYTPKPIRFVDGFSESAWKSLVVKSLRIGWPQGLTAASERLNKSTVKALLHAGLFEDVFPSGFTGISEAVTYIEQQDWEALCSIETHHGRGFTEAFCDLEKEAVANGRKEGYELMEIVKRNTNLQWLNPRIFNCLYTWFKINPLDARKTRDTMDMPFTGIPNNVLDAHTYEGKIRKTSVLLLSGHYHNHRAIGKEVMTNGWDNIRDKFANDEVAPLQATAKRVTFQQPTLGL
jgi:hypothetical protein